MSKNWICPICDHENPDDAEVCRVCGAYREEPAYDAIADEGYDNE